MPIQKKPEAASGKTDTATAVEKGRKPWKKKSPVEVVLDQEQKLKREIAEMEAELKQKRSQLERFEQARKIFEQP